MDITVAAMFNYIVVILWFLSIIFSMWKLRNIPANETSKAIWAGIILLVPFLGAAAFLFISNAKQRGKS